MKNYLSIFFLSLFLFSCNKEADQVAELEGTVLSIHDEVMPKMDEIMTLKARLSKKILTIDSLQNEGISGNSLAEQRIRATDLNQKLNESDKLMMDWMHEYRGDSAKKLKPAQAINYFKTEKNKIDAVRQATLKAINETKAFLEN